MSRRCHSQAVNRHVLACKVAVQGVGRPERGRGGVGQAAIGRGLEGSLISAFKLKLVQWIVGESRRRSHRATCRGRRGAIAKARVRLESDLDVEVARVCGRIPCTLSVAKLSLDGFRDLNLHGKDYSPVSLWNPSGQPTPGVAVVIIYFRRFCGDTAWRAAIT
jgi:hypothetical protein